MCLYVSIDCMSLSQNFWDRRYSLPHNAKTPQFFAVSDFSLASQEGFEPPTYGLEVRCSIRLSYWDKYGAGEGNRTLVIGLEGRRSTIELHPPENISYSFIETYNIITKNAPGVKTF